MGLDSARDAFVSLEGARMLQFPTTGPFISIAPVTTGPWYWIQLILARIILPTTLAPWLLLGIYSMGTVIVMYAVGILLEGQLFGLILAGITALSANQIQTAYELTNPSVIGFYASLDILLFILLIKKGPSKRLGLLWGVLLGFTVNTHYQSTGLLTLPLLLLAYKSKYKDTLIKTALGFSLTFLPTLYFELMNHWFNTRHMLQYILVDQYKIWTPMRWLTYISDYWPNFISFVLGGKKYVGTAVMSLIVIVMSWQLWKRKLPKIYILLGISFIIEVIIIRYYRGERFFGYLQFFHPYLFIFLGYVFYQIFRVRYGSTLCAIVILLYITAIFPSLTDKLQTIDFTAASRKMLADVYQKFGPGPYKIFRCKTDVKQETTALVLALNMENNYSSDGKPLLYHWSCNLPRFRVDGTYISDKEMAHPEKIYPKFDFLYDVSTASPAALLALGYVEASPKSMYQSAARWWMDEQP